MRSATKLQRFMPGCLELSESWHWFQSLLTTWLDHLNSQQAILLIHGEVEAAMWLTMELKVPQPQIIPTVGSFRDRNIPGILFPILTVFHILNYKKDTTSYYIVFPKDCKIDIIFYIRWNIDACLFANKQLSVHRLSE